MVDSTDSSRSTPVDLPLSTLEDGGGGGGVLQDTKGKHRIMAELKRLEQETRFLEQELEGLEKLEKASTACQELVDNMENNPDPLLPVIYGPANPSWERWFEGPQDTRGRGLCGCICWMF